MPNRLLSFELHGYKTFASKTEFIFSDGITAIVGPNGSGKSNIADALRWVLGEQSYGLLRGKRTEDMIFAGSEQRSRAGMAQATVVFNNIDGWLPIDFTEVAITRRAYRDGDNEYLLNGHRVRLKDVSEILAKSGLAERTYTIIGQGLVDAALALRAEDRRALFEEAAGIGLYRGRRDDALRRLEATRRNLERVQDILAELQPRLRSLERQAKRAQEYEQIRADLRESLRLWYGYHWHRAQADYIEAQTAARQQEEILRSAQDAAASVDEKITSFRQHLHQLRQELSKEQKVLAELHQRREEVFRNIVRTKERMRSLTLQLEESKVELSRQQEALAFLGERKLQARVEEEQLTSDLNEFSTQLSTTEQDYHKSENERLATENTIRELKDDLSDLFGKKAQQQARLEEKRASRNRLQDSIAMEQAGIERIQAELLSSQEYSLSIQQQQTNVADQVKISQNEHDVLLATYKEAENTSVHFQKEKANIEAQIARIKTEMNVVEQAEKNLMGYADGAQVLLSSIAPLDSKGIIGAVGRNIIVPEAYELAIAAALGEYIDAVVYKDSSRVEGALDLLIKKEARGAIFPLDSVNPPRSIKIDLNKVPGGQDLIIGIAADLVNYAADFHDIVDILLGQVIIVKDRNIVKALLTGRNWKSLPGLRVVTMTGELYSANGMIAVGSPGRGILSRPRQLSELKKSLQSMDDIYEEVDTNYAQAVSALTNLSERYTRSREHLDKLTNLAAELMEKLHKLELAQENIRNNLAWRLDQKINLEAEIANNQQSEIVITNELDAINCEVDVTQSSLQLKMREYENMSTRDDQSQFLFWKTRTAVTEQAVNDAARRHADLVKGEENGKLEIDAIQKRIDRISENLARTDIEHGELERQELTIITDLDAQQTRIIAIENAIENEDTRQGELLSKDSEERQRFRTAEHFHAQAKINLARKHEGLVSLQRRVEDDFGLVAFDYDDAITGPKPLPLEGLVEKLPYVNELPEDVDDGLQRQKNQLRRMGPINLEAQNEYQEVRSRYDFMSEQTGDLHKAERDIQEVITELDILMQREFRKTFDAVAIEFRTIFHRLFNGGSAHLVLTDPENITDSGIDIEARLPGRREQGLSLLSGGERSLTAVALVFALLKISPTPFCILDEVDAMLDETNVGRFRELLTELSVNTQFIVITHNRNTVQAAGVIYGVTMGRDSTSQVIGLKLDEVSEDYGV